MPEAWTLPKPISGGFRLENPSRSGGAAFNGAEQNVFSLAMRWRAKWTIPIRTNAEVLAARALSAKLQGKAGVLLVPFFDGKRVSWPIDEWGRLLNPAQTRRRQLDGTAYEDPEVPDDSEIEANVIGNTAIRATSIEVEISQGGVPLPGQYFGLRGERGYLIKSVTPLLSPPGYTLTFVPPLRDDADDADSVNFTRPVCMMNQVSDDQGIAELEQLRFATLDLEFVEAFD